MTKIQAKRTTDADLATEPQYEVTPQQLKRMLEQAPDQVFVVDLRGAEEYSAGHIPTARNIPMVGFDASYPGLPRDILIVAYCGGVDCGFSLSATYELAGSGLRAKRLVGGMEGWRRTGFPVETRKPERTRKH